MVDSRALQSEYVWPETVADRKCTYIFPPKVDAYMYAANTAPKQKGQKQEHVYQQEDSRENLDTYLQSHCF